MNRTFDRLRHVDLRSLAYRIQAPAPTYRPRSFTWRLGPRILDQGSQGSCVGMGWANELQSRPSMVEHVDEDTARSIYYKAQALDEWPGSDYSGTSVLAGAKACRQDGWIGEYRWCLTVDDLVVALGYHGPVVIGVDWYTGMIDTDAEGFIRPTGFVEGGHCVLLNRVALVRSGGVVDPVLSFVQGVNSWGPGWGFAGTFRIALVDVAVLFPGGDWCVPMGRRLEPKPAV